MSTPDPLARKVNPDSLVRQRLWARMRKKCTVLAE
ncbi:hypothetical protein BJ970_007634 [Saccharopolyspora phatthalungensis]|uniref:Uncharacterized protein n=1 Tax=Saccharopolyspora phatthalungensis TaxID=664693 RepID=A0A840QL02_9PSEU|nr:hypothetical protein [Saccharopolyspora phatthalungensis]